jgi:hypothetical protein
MTLTGSELVNLLQARFNSFNVKQGYSFPKDKLVIKHPSRVLNYPAIPPDAKHLTLKERSYYGAGLLAELVE